MFNYPQRSQSQTEAIRSSLLTARGAAFDEVDEQVEHLRLDGNVFRTAAQLAAAGVKCMICQKKLQFAVPNRAPTPPSSNNQARLKDKSSFAQSLSFVNLPFIACVSSETR